jgi:phosphate:Na+ symporter
MQAQSIELLPLISGLLGGLALFLYGLDKMGNALKLISGYKLKKIMTNLTKNRFLSLGTGTVLTAMVQSSSATTVLLVGFVSAEMLTLTQALGVILGADIGTTLTVQLIAFKVTKYALIPLAIGFFLKALAKTEKMENLGRTLLGVGLLFYGIELMSVSMSPLRTHAPFIDMMSQMHNPFYAIWFGALFTAAVQSSAATLAIIIALATQGLIDINSGIGLMLGANIGTCITAGLACIGKNKAAQRTAAAHIFFKVAGIIIIFPFLGPFAEFIRWIYPLSEGTEISTAVARDIANAHLVFNVFIAILFLPFIHQIARFLTWLIPDREQDNHMKTKYLDEDLFNSPSLALSAARREVYRMGTYIERMLTQTMPAIEKLDNKELNAINKQDEFIDYLYAEINSYLVKLSKQELTSDQSEELLTLMQIVSDFESIGDLLERDIVDIGKKCINEQLELSGELQNSLEKTFNAVKETFTLVLISVNDPNVVILEEVKKKKTYLKRLTNKLNNDKLDVARENFEELKNYSLCSDLVDTYTRIFYHNQKIAKNLQTQEITDDK